MSPPASDLSGTLARLAYSTLLRLATPLYFARLWWRGRSEPGYRQHWGERLAIGGPAAPPGAIWVHAVSLGEARAASVLVDALRALEPGRQFLFTHGTATGREAGRALLKAGDTQVWFPYDTPGAVRRFLQRHRPAVGLLMETEVWPNLQHAARQQLVPMVLANARLSAKSLAQAERWAGLLGPAAASITLALAQTEADARRLERAGAPRVRVCGNLKFDMAPPPGLLTLGRQWRQVVHRPVVLAASTRDGEEPPLLQAWAALPAPRPLLLIVPRHPQRFDEVAGMVRAAGMSLHRRSSWGTEPPAAAAGADRSDVWLGDSLGEMALYYAMSDVALLGGSFAPLGGQNLIEAAACGCPVVMGPHTFNFAQAAELSIEAGASLRVADIGEGVARAVALASDPARDRWVGNALDFSAAHRGAAQRMALEVQALVARASPVEASAR